ncbi:MAG: phosphodiester glycosidase family protein, partial [Planctomycetota bacterium]
VEGMKSFANAAPGVLAANVLATCVLAAATPAALAQQGDFVTSGSACPAGAAPQLEILGVPQPGLAPIFRVADAPADTVAGFLFVGTATTSVPLDGLGAAGCVVQVDPILTLAMDVASAEVELVAPLADNAALLGATLELQALIVAPSANPAAIALTERGTATLGAPAWEPLFVGIDAAFFDVQVENRPQRIYAARVDLLGPAVEFFVTPSNGDAPLETQSQRATEFLNEFDQSIAINTAFFGPCCSFIPEPKDVIGLSVSEGQEVSPFKLPGAGAGSVVLVIRDDNSAEIFTTDAPVDLSGIDSAMAGSDFIVEGGLNVGAEHISSADPFNLNPRTCAGLSADGRWLYLVVFDGRQPGVSNGVTVIEAGDWMRVLGSEVALNLDGGGSTTLVAATPQGAQVINDPVNAGQVDVQRLNASHLGVTAPALE